MRRGRRKRIAIVMGLADTYEHGIARGVVRYAKGRSDWDLYGYAWMFRPFDALEVWQGDGIIARIESRRDAELIGKRAIPVVDVAGAYRVSSITAVTNDDEATGRLAGEYLASCGFRRFAYCGAAGTQWSALRQKGFLSAVSGFAERPGVFEGSLPWWERLDSSGRLRSWLAGLHRPIGVFACNDTAGLKIVDLCRDLGIPVPDDVAVLGVDNEDVLCEMASPTLSSIELDCESIGYRAAVLLNDLIAGSGPRPAGSPLLVPPKEVVERASTRVFACDDPIVARAMRYIRHHGTSRLHVVDILSEVAASRRSLETRFRKATGRTLLEEIMRVRLSHARAMLRSTRLTVGDVARECGFGSAQRFHEAFRRAEGVSPGSYRRGAP
jgi:LacI family transcriptional regulator